MSGVLSMLGGGLLVLLAISTASMPRGCIAEECAYRLTAMGIAVLRYRLYDIDLVINRALVYGPLTAMLVLVYLGGVVSLQYALRVLTGQESQIALVASTLAIAALFNPLRR